MTTVNVTEQNYNVTVTEGDTTTVTVTESATTLVTVKEVGPQGPPGLLQEGNVGDLTVSVAGNGTQSVAINTGAVTSTKLANSGVTSGSYGSGSAIPTITVNDKGIVTSISTSSINTDLVADTSPQLGGNLDLNSKNITGTGDINITGDISISGTVDGRDLSVDGSKLDGIESNATADQTKSDIDALGIAATTATTLANARTIAGTSFNGSANIDISYANLTNKLSVGDGGLTQNNFTDTLKSKLDGIDTGAKDDQTAAEIKTLLNSDGIVNAQIDASAAIAGSKINPTFTTSISQSGGGDNTFGNNIQINTIFPSIFLNDTDSENDFYIQNRNGLFAIRDADAGGGTNRFTIASDGTATFTQNLNANAGLDVTGNIITTGQFQATGSGTSSGLKISNAHDSVYQFFVNNNNNSDFYISYGGSGGPEIKLGHDGKITLSHGSTTRIETTTVGALITGNLGILSLIHI